MHSYWLINIQGHFNGSMPFTFIGTCCEGRMFFLSCLFSSYVFTSVTVSVFSFLLNQREKKACRLLVAWNNGPIFILCYWTPGVRLLQCNHSGSTCKKLLATMESFCICAYAVSFQAHFIHSGAGVSILSSLQERSGFELPGQLGRGGCGVCCSPCAFFWGVVMYGSNQTL